LQKFLKGRKMMEYTAIIEKTPSGWYIAQCEQVPGAMTQGRTLEEVRENLKEAIALVLDAEKELCIKRYKSEGRKFIRRKIAML
jgi:predicted RNase H-like HicB family nuclease